MRDWLADLIIRVPEVTGSVSLGGSERAVRQSASATAGLTTADARQETPHVTAKECETGEGGTVEFLLLAAEMEATPLELTPASGFGAVFFIVQLILGVLFVVVPLGLLIYVVILLRRLTDAVQGIEQHLASPGMGDKPSTS